MDSSLNTLPHILEDALHLWKHNRALPVTQTENESWKISPCLPALAPVCLARVRISINFVYDTSITWNSPQSPPLPLYASPWPELHSLPVQLPHPHLCSNLWSGNWGRGWDSGQNLRQRTGMEHAAFLGKSDGQMTAAESLCVSALTFPVLVK